LVISHRPASIKMSDKIILMAAGDLEDIGSYKDLVTRNDNFRDMMAHSVNETSDV